MTWLSPLILLNFVFIFFVSGKDRHCQLTSNLGNVSDVVVTDLHQMLIIKCSSTAANTSDLKVEWKKNYDTLSNVASILKWTDVAWDDAGKYECVVRSGQSFESCKIIVKVKTAPRVTIGPYDMFKNAMRLPCRIDGSFKPDKVIWYKDGKEIIPDKISFDVKYQNVSEFVLGSTLTRRFPSLNDSGNYSCEARNEYGMSRGYKFVSKTIIRGFMQPTRCPEFKNKSTKINVTISLGSSTSLLCDVMFVFVFGKKDFFGITEVGNNNGNNTMHIPHYEKNIYKQAEKNSTLSLNYTIVNAQQNDSRQYACDFINSDYYHCPENLKKIFNVKVVSQTGNVQENQVKKVNLPMVIAVSVLGALCGLALVLYVRHLRRKVKFYDSCPDDIPELRWDVFVSYSSHDFAWVDNLCRMLERPPFNLSVCLHQRDWELGRSIVDNMVDSVYCSQKTLIILSKHYVESQYCMQELQIAMHSEIASELLRRDRIILVKIDDVSMHCLPRVLRQKSYLDCSNNEHAKHFETNLLRVLPRRETLEEEDQQNSLDESESSDSNEICLQEIHVWPQDPETGQLETTTSSGRGSNQFI